MEKQQKGEQFQILDPANLSIKPVRPNRLMIILVGIVAGLADGIGLALFWDNLEFSFRRSEEIGAYVDVPLLATLPAVVTATVLCNSGGLGGYSSCFQLEP